MNSPKVAVVGSGLTGLLVAQGLRKNGVSVTVYEGDSSLDSRARDWTLMLHWGLNMLHQILPQDIQATFSEAFCDPFYTQGQPPALPCFNGITGEQLFQIPSTTMRLVSRQRFRRVLSRGLSIQFNRRLVSIAEKGSGPVTLIFEDGARQQADIVIGADGANSFVRAHLLGKEKATPVRTPWVVSVALFSFNNVAKARFARNPHPVWHMGYGPDGICALAVSDVKAANDPSEWEFAYFKLWHDQLSRPIQGTDALERFKEKSETFCEPYRSAAQWIPPGSSCHIDQLKYWAPEPWNNPSGRITPAGDAAHAILPFRGQGLNHCLDDVRQLVDSIIQIRDGADRIQVMQKYDRHVCERGRAAVLASLEEGRKKMNFDMLMTSKTASQGFSKEGPRI